jgi:hypothetical protein
MAPHEAATALFTGTVGAIGMLSGFIYGRMTGLAGLAEGFGRAYSRAVDSCIFLEHSARGQEARNMLATFDIWVTNGKDTHHHGRP